ncbi:MAG: O-antigen ligase family protein [Gammaproteobacteria bacterium]|nr:O-antigen ligase family protein [Gammaproteobacteria bacterium]
MRVWGQKSARDAGAAISCLDRNFPSAYPRARAPVLAWIALFALVLFALSNFIEPTLARKGEWLLLIATLLACGQIRREDPDAWLYIAMFLFLGLMLWMNWRAAREWGAGYDHFSYTRDYMRLFWFLMAGWWLGGRERNIFVLFAIAVAALFITIQSEGGLSSWVRLLKGHRVDFNLHNAEHVGLLFGSVLIGLLSFMFRFFDNRRRLAARMAWAMLWLLLFSGTTAVVLGAQTRQTWLGFALAMIASLAFLLSNRLSGNFPVKRLIGISVAIGLVIAAGLSTNSFDRMVKRVTVELNGVELLQMDDINIAQVNSSTTRLILWKTAFDAISKRPLLGYGGAARKIVIEHADLPASIRKYGHFHNSYLELWLSYGIAGPLIFIAMLVILGRRLMQACRSGHVTMDFAVFGVAWLVFFAVANMFESYVSYRTGAYLMLIVGGALYSIAIPARRAARTV